MFLVFFFPLARISFPSHPLIPLVAEGYLCSSLEHIGEQKPRRMVSQVTAVCKGGGDIYIHRYIIRFRSKFFSALMSQLPSVMLGGKWGGCPVSPLVPLPFKILFIFLLFDSGTVPVVSEQRANCGCGKYLCGCSSLCISNSWTRVTTCWTCWTLLALKRCWSECLGVLAWISWDLEQGGTHW